MNDYPFYEETIDMLQHDLQTKNNQLLKLQSILNDVTLCCDNRVEIALELIDQLQLPNNEDVVIGETTNTPKEYVIKWLDNEDKFLLELDGKVFKSYFVEHLLDEIATSHNHVCEDKYSESHYKAKLQDELGIVIKLDFSY